MAASVRHGVTRRLAPAVAAAALVLPQLVAAPLTPAAAGPSAARSDTSPIVLQSLTPAVTDAGDDVTVELSVPASTRGAQVVARVERNGLDTPAKVDGWAHGEGGAHGARTEVARATVTGTSVRLTIPADKVPSDFASATLPLALTLEQGGAVLGDLHTYLVRDTGTHATPLEVGIALPLTLTGDAALLSPDTAARVEAWTRQTGPDSPAHTALSTLDSPDVAWVVDPTLLTPLTSPDDAGSPTPAPSAATSSPPTAPSPTPTAAITRPPTPPPSLAVDPQTALTSADDELGALVRAAAQEGRTWALGRSDIDLGAIGADPAHEGLIERAFASRLPRALEGSERLAWPVRGTVTPELLSTAYRTLGTEVPVALDAAGLGGGRQALVPLQPAPRSAEGQRLLPYDAGLSSLLTAEPAGGSSPAERRQRLLAELLAVHSRAPGQSRGLVLLPPRGELDLATARSAIPALREASFVDLQPATGVAHWREAPARVWEAPRGTRVHASPLTGGGVASLSSLRRAQQSRDSLLGATQTERTAAWQARDLLTSTAWRGHASQWREVVGRERGAADHALAGVTVRSGTVNLLADSGLLQVTLDNDLDHEVRDVSISLRPANSRLAIVDEPAPVTIGAGSRTTVKVRAEALAAGQVPIEVTLRTASGARVGSPGTLTVNVQPTSGWLVWSMGIVAALVLVAGVVRTVRAGRRIEKEPIDS